MKRLILFSSALCFVSCGNASTNDPDIPENDMPVAEDSDLNTLVENAMNEEREITRDDPERIWPVQPVSDVPSAEDRVDMETVIDGLDEPWGLDFISADTMLVTEKTGKFYQVSTDGLKTEISGVPAVKTYGQAGLLDVAVDPEGGQTPWIYLSFSHELPADPDKAMTKLVRGQISDGEWVNEEVLFEAAPQHYVQARVHYGSRITFDDAGHLYFSIGDRGQKEMAQDISRPNGKIHRINKDGTIPGNNPFVDNDGAYASIYSFGNRNPQGLIIHPQTGDLWETEHGPRGGDELNKIEAGQNYGWPEISYGINYSGSVMTNFVAKPGLIQPESQWTPSIAVCGLDVYTGNLWPEWTGQLLVGSLAFETLRLVDVSGGDYQGEVTLLEAEGRIRDVTTGPDGAIYVALPEKIVKLTPQN